jgi:hypothetical protein
MSPVKPSDFSLLLEVFREGLVRGIMSKEEIIAWADAIIRQEDEPDYFFIELSLSNNVNGFVEVIDRYTKLVNAPICYRVLLALIYDRHLNDDPETIEATASLVGSLCSWDILSSFEENSIYMFDEYYIYHSTDLNQLYTELHAFLSIYKTFTLDNYERWEDINRQVFTN